MTFKEKSSSCHSLWRSRQPARAAARNQEVRLEDVFPEVLASALRFMLQEVVARPGL